MSSIDRSASSFKRPDAQAVARTASRLLRRRRRTITTTARLWGLAIAVLLPGIALPEGAVKVLVCTTARICDGAGTCGPASGQVTFTMEPLDLQAPGSARYTLSYRDTRVEMQAVSDAGPFLWSVGQERDALLASSETEWLWHQLALSPAPKATIRFLRCSFQQ